ncbi:DUF4158 domain-containing protein (plasmid) [Neorhizobium galegae]|nr:DUF4158 domain-containing protein [Neorhizobium galegae]
MAFLDEQSRAVLFEPPKVYEDAQARYALSSEDIAFAKEHRRSHNRLGFAIQLALVRDLGRLLRTGEVPPQAVVSVVADQLGVDPAVFGLYAQREETRREHAREIVSALELQPIRTNDYRELITAAAREAAATEQGAPITKAIIEALKEKKAARFYAGAADPSGTGRPGCSAPTSLSRIDPGSGAALDRGA